MKPRYKYVEFWRCRPARFVRPPPYLNSWEGNVEAWVHRAGVFFVVPFYGPRAI